MRDSERQGAPGMTRKLSKETTNGFQDESKTHYTNYGIGVPLIWVSDTYMVFSAIYG